MDNVLADMVNRLRAIELLLRTQNEVLSSVLAELEHMSRRTNTNAPGEKGDLKEESRVRKRA